MTRGRKPKPTALRLAHHSAVRVNQHEPQHAPLDEAVPEQLKDPLAREEWTRIMNIVRHTGHIQAVDKAVDKAVMLAYCRKGAQLQRVEDEAAKHPTIVKGANGNPMPNPALSLANRTATPMSGQVQIG